jgi:hypothetical protein
VACESYGVTCSRVAVVLQSLGLNAAVFESRGVWELSYVRAEGVCACYMCLYDLYVC